VGRSERCGVIRDPPSIHWGLQRVAAVFQDGSTRFTLGATVSHSCECDEGQAGECSGAPWGRGKVVDNVLISELMGLS
jgi:hypothetical protein